MTHLSEEQTILSEAVNNPNQASIAEQSSPQSIPQYNIGFRITKTKTPKGTTQQQIEVYDKDTDESYFVADLPSTTLRNKAKRIIADLNSLTSVLPDMFNEFVNDVIPTFKRDIISDPIVAFINKWFPVVIEYVFEHGYQETQKGQSSLFMTQDEIKYVLATCIMSKIAVLFLASLDEYHNKQILKAVYQPMVEHNLIQKLLGLIGSKITPFRHTDTRMWTFLKLVVAKTPETHTVDLLLFILKNVFPVCSIDKNPIVYILSVAGECVKWIVHGIYTPPEFSRSVPTSVTDVSNALNNVASMKIIEQIKQWCLNNIPESRRERIINFLSNTTYSTQLQLLMIKIFKNVFDIAGSVVKRLSPEDIAYVCWFMHLGSRTILAYSEDDFIKDNKKYLAQLIRQQFTDQYSVYRKSENLQQSSSSNPSSMLSSAASALLTNYNIKLNTHPLEIFARPGLGKLIKSVPNNKISAQKPPIDELMILSLPLSAKGLAIKPMITHLLKVLFGDATNYNYIDIETEKPYIPQYQKCMLDLIILLYQKCALETLYDMLQPLTSLITEQQQLSVSTKITKSSHEAVL